MEISIVPSLDEVAPEAWDALVGRHNPFVEHAFLSLLERSKSVGPGTGWLPAYVVVKRRRELLGAVPAYLKDDGYGEYIFDWAWADAAARAGLPYYPKLTVAVPFTPATGPRLLVREDAPADEVREALLHGLDALAKEVDAQGAHFLFCLDEEAAFLEGQGYLRRATHQFHWRNDRYDSFDGEGKSFLGALRAEARKQIRKERRRAQDGLTLETRRGDTLSDEEWRAMNRLYRSTADRKWGSPYLTRAFFEGAKATVGARAVVVFARRGHDIVAGALSFEKGAHLYGRYWGAFEELDCLHFEVCYYQLIERAIEMRASLVEAGAQGPHKLKRGFLPVITHSAHKLTHPALHDAVARAMRQEASHVRSQVEGAQQDGPFREDALPTWPPLAGIPLPMDSQD